MSNCAIQTVFTWSKEGETALCEFWRGEDYYCFGADPRTLQKVLRLVGICAADRSLSLTWDDAAQITSTLRMLVPETETAYITSYEQAVEAVVENSYVRWLGFTLVASCVFWCCVGWLVVKALN